jgi:hypothetical protein
VRVVIHLRFPREPSVLNWFYRWVDKVAQRQPVSAWRLDCAGEVLQATTPDHQVLQVAKSELSGVIIDTNDSGPVGDDVWWVLLGADGGAAVVYPQGAPGEEAMLDYLLALPGFDHEEMIRAMGCTDNTAFKVWRKPQ